MTRSRALALCATLALAALPLRADHHEAAASGALSDADRAALVTMLEQGLADTDALVAKAEGETFTTKPAPDRWSPAEVLEHIAVVEEALLGMALAALETEIDPEGPQLLAAQPVAGMATMVQDRSKRFQAPAEVQPKGGIPRDELVARYHAARAKTLDFVRTTEADVVGHTTAGPMGKMTVHHVLALIAGHNLRHNQQFAEALEQNAAAMAAPAASHQ